MSAAPVLAGHCIIHPLSLTRQDPKKSHSELRTGHRDGKRHRVEDFLRRANEWIILSSRKGEKRAAPSVPLDDEDSCMVKEHPPCC